MDACDRTRGFSLIELLMATALMLLVMAAALAVVDPVRAASTIELESVDMEQRLRVAVHTLSADLAMAGAGAAMGADAGPLISQFAAVWPYRIGRVGADPPGTFKADAVTVLYVPPASSQTTLSTELSAGQLSLRVHEAGCPQSQDLCGFAAGMTILVHDRDGHFDTFTLRSTTASEGVLTVNSPGGAMQASYPVGSTVLQVVQRTYAVKVNAQGISQLVSYDGSGAGDTPVLDHVAGFTVEYYGDPQPPRLSRPASDPLGPHTTYGPGPPGCTFTWDASTGVHVPRLPVLGGDVSGRRALVRLTPATLSDGDIWCPDTGAARRFDADLLRIRKVAVAIRIEPTLAARRLLSDREVRFLVTPRNLNLRP